MELIVTPTGTIRCIYDEAIDLASIGVVHTRRASFVEPDTSGTWWADLSPIGGPQCGPYAKRSEALAAERLWLMHNVLATAPAG